LSVSTREGGGAGVLTSGAGDVASGREAGAMQMGGGGGGGGREGSSDVSRIDAFPDLGEDRPRGRQGGI